jgi:hypothetical protein
VLKKYCWHQVLSRTCICRMTLTVLQNCFYHQSRCRSFNLSWLQSSETYAIAITDETVLLAVTHKNCKCLQVYVSDLHFAEC